MISQPLRLFDNTMKTAAFITAGPENGKTYHLLFSVYSSYKVFLTLRRMGQLSQEVNYAQDWSHSGI